MRSQADKGHVFRTLHETGDTFVIPNPWDIATARILASAGFQALATTSAGYAFSQGKGDHRINRDEMLQHLTAIANATDLPVSADLGNGYGNDPETVAETIRLAAATGIVGGSIEDSPNDGTDGLYPIEYAAQRVRAAVEAARALPFPFTITARAENFLIGHNDLDDTIKRLQAYQAAGADVLYAPCINTEEQITRIIAAVDRPINVLMGRNGGPFTVQQLAKWGVKRISVGADLTLVAFGAVARAGKEMLEQGTFSALQSGLTDRSFLEQ